VSKKGLWLGAEQHGVSEIVPSALGFSHDLRTSTFTDALPVLSVVTR
jgi:hypothetical protein